MNRIRVYFVHSTKTKKVLVMYRNYDLAEAGLSLSQRLYPNEDIKITEYELYL